MRLIAYMLYCQALEPALRVRYWIRCGTWLSPRDADKLAYHYDLIALRGKYADWRH